MRRRVPWVGVVALSIAVGASGSQQPEPEEPLAGQKAEDGPLGGGVGPALAASPGSLWPGFEPYVDMVSDLRAKRVGDLVTIRVVENVRASQAADTAADRDTDVAGGISTLFGVEGHLPSSISLDPLLGASSSTAFSGGGANSRTNSLRATITATVTQVLPNGNLVIEASRLVKVNEEEEKLTVRGTIRRYDIGPGNDVLSTSVANIEIDYGGKGAIGSNLKPGFLFRLIRFIF